MIPATEIVVENIPEKELLARKKKILTVCTGGMYSEVQKAVRSVILKGGYSDIYTLRFIKPFDEEYFIKLAKKYKGLVIVEDGCRIGGMGEYLLELLSQNGIKNTLHLAFDDKYYGHGNRGEVLEMAGLSPLDIENAINSLSQK